MEKSIDVVRSLIRFFNGEIIGSYMFVEKGLLKEKDINDIDVQVNKSVIDNVQRYLEDKGYTQKKTRGNQLGYTRKTGTLWEIIPSLVFTKEGKTTIHIKEKTDDVWSIPNLIKSKTERGKHSDYVQLLKVFDKLSKENLWYYRSNTLGLYATYSLDKIPDDKKMFFFRLEKRGVE